MGERPEVLVKFPLQINANQPDFVINFHQDSETSMHSDFFQGQTYKDLFNWPNLSGELSSPNKKEKEKELMLLFSN
jgi:hypothetical protein